MALDTNEMDLAKFAEWLVSSRMVKEQHAPFYVRWVRSYLTRPIQVGTSLADRVDQFLDDVRREGTFQDWQVAQADRALRLYYHNFQKDTDWSAEADSSPDRKPLHSDAYPCSSVFIRG